LKREYLLPGVPSVDDSVQITVDGRDTHWRVHHVVWLVDAGSVYVVLRHISGADGTDEEEDDDE
jgi:hypothetical protein